MSSNDYARHIAQKYRLAIAIAILNIKPTDLTVDEYLDQIKNIIHERNTKDDDLDVSACSDDFNIDSSDEFDDQNQVTHDHKEFDDQNRIEVSHEANDNDQNYMNQYRLSHDPKDLFSRNNDHDIEGNEFVVHKTQFNDAGTKIKDEKTHNNVKRKNKEITQGNDNKVYDEGMQVNIQEIDLNTSETILNNFQIPEDDTNKERREQFRELIKVLKGVDVVTTDKIVMNGSPKVLYDSLQTQPFDPMDTDLTQCYDDNYSIVKSIEILNNIDENMKHNRQDYYETQRKDHKMQSNEQNVVTEIKNKDSISQKNAYVPDTTDEQGNTKDRRKRIGNNDVTNIFEPKITKNDQVNTKGARKNIKNSKNSVFKPAIAKNTNVENNMTAIKLAAEGNSITNENSTNMNLKTIRHKDQTQTPVYIDIDTQETIIYTNTQYNTHYSPSQMNEIAIDNQFIHGSKQNIDNATIYIDKQFDVNENIYTKNLNKAKEIEHIDLLHKESMTLNKDVYKNIKESKKDYTNDAVNAQSEKTNAIENDIAFSTQNMDLYDTLKLYSTETNAFDHSENDWTVFDKTMNNDRNSDIEITDSGIAKSIENDCTVFDKTTNEDTNNERINEDSVVSGVPKSTENDGTVFDITTNDNSNNERINEDLIVSEALKSTENDCIVFDKTTNVDGNNGTEITDGDEKVPFRIIEEVNRIKIFLRRKELKEISSGFRSSQSKSTFGGSQLPISWIGQSASNVFSYLCTCSLLTATQDITEQISEILGQLIDRLHEEEIYPTFLEDLLNTITKLLQQIYEDQNYVFDVLQQKDEQFQRILLLNKSTHIQKFTIEKINNILQKLLDDLSADSSNEASNINKIENVCYIFEILQFLLPKYSLNSQNSSQNSQDDKILRKKDITDIWRKKWIDNSKDTKNEGSLEIKCVLKECSSILNKIIINLIDGYSLIAFLALKCFNKMQ